MIEGIIIFDELKRVDKLEFSLEHGGCNFIAKRTELAHVVEVLAYAEERWYNGILKKYYYDNELRREGYLYFHGISESEIAGIG